jgi:hypothetical protein
MPSSYVRKRPHYDAGVISSCAETESHMLQAKAKLHTSSPGSGPSPARISVRHRMI